MKDVALLLKATAMLLVLLTVSYGSAYTKGEKMLNIIDLEGSYFEIGEKWGHAVKDDVKIVIANELGGLAQFLSLKKEELISLSAKYVPVAEEYDPDFIQVLKGFSKGASLPFEEIFALRTLLETTFYMDRIQSMCSCFALTGNATEGGKTIIGQNIDWRPGSPMSLLRITWPNGVKQLSLSLGGIWEYSLSSHESSSPFGLVAALTVSRSDNQDIKQVPVSIVMSKAARQKRLERALSVFINSQQNMASYLLANGDGDMVGIECAANGYEVMCPEKDTLVRANHYLTDRFKPMDFFAKFVPDSYLRYYRLKRLIEKDYGKITPSLMMKKLADHNSFPKSICAHVDPDSVLPPSATIASVIMVPEEKVMYIAVGNPCENEYMKYTID